MVMLAAVSDLSDGLPAWELGIFEYAAAAIFGKFFFFERFWSLLNFLQNCFNTELSKRVRMVILTDFKNSFQCTPE